MKAFIILLLLTGSVFADDSVVKERVINACLGEAEGESYRGKLAVICSVINRTSKMGSLDKALKGIYGEKAPRVVKKLYPESARQACEDAYYEALGVFSCDFVDGATHWEGTAFKTPYWAKDMVMTATIGNQRFYKEKTK
jgi:spore germination cell wall hydrolase CwlJ-like protein